MENPKKKMTLKEFVAKALEDIKFTHACDSIRIEASVVPYNGTLVISEVGLGHKITIPVYPEDVSYDELNQVLGR